MTLRCRLLCAAVVAALPAAPAAAEPSLTCPIRLSDATADSGIGFVHTDGGGGEYYIVESVVAGLALFDYDGDGLIDVYFLNGAPLKGTVVDTPPRNALYRNNGDGTFTDVTEEAGVGDLGYGLGVTVGDFNNNGHQDLYLNNFGPNVLYRNNGDGTFTDATHEAGVACGDLVGAGASFLDIDGNGLLDLYVSNYVDFTYEKHIERTIGRYRFHPGPRDYPPMPDILLRNNGDGTFTDISASSGIAAVAGTGMGMVSFDYTGNGFPDVFVCNDHFPNFLFRNDGTGRFEEVGLVAGVAYDFHGNENGSMGADCGDFDNDGLLDLFMTNYSSEMPVLYRNIGGAFEDVTRRSKAGSSAFPHVTWGTGFVDFANDGRRDIFIACGHFMDNIYAIDDRTTVHVPNILMMNTGDGRFVDVSDRCGDGMAVVESSRGAGFDDLSNNGYADVVILNTNSRPTILRNETDSGNRWLQLSLRGVTSNRDAVGARVTVVAGDLTQVAEVHSGRGYQSHFGSRLYFGLGNRERVDRIEVRWPGGGSERFSGRATNQHVLLTEGTGTPRP